MRPVERVLFVRTDRIGDFLMNLPAIRLLRQTFPKAWLAVMIDASVAPLVRRHPDIDELVTVEGRRLEREWGYRLGVYRRMRAASFDLGVVSNPSKALHLMLYWAGIPHRIGYARKWGFLLTKKMVDRKGGSGRHEIDLNLELASLASDRSWDGQVSLPVEEEAARSVEALLARDAPGEGPVILVHPGTTDPAKRWPEEAFARLCDHVDEARWGVAALVGGPEEAQVSARVAAACRRKPIDWTGRLRLEELSALLHHRRARALISSDSGPVHVAWMSGTPCVVLYPAEAGGADPARWGPRDGVSRAIRAPGRDITPERVRGELAALLEQAPPPKRGIPAREVGFGF